MTPSSIDKLIERIERTKTYASLDFSTSFNEITESVKQLNPRLAVVAGGEVTNGLGEESREVIVKFLGDDVCTFHVTTLIDPDECDPARKPKAQYSAEEIENAVTKGLQRLENVYKLSTEGFNAKRIQERLGGAPIF